MIVSSNCLLLSIIVTFSELGGATWFYSCNHLVVLRIAEFWAINICLTSEKKVDEKSNVNYHGCN